MRVLFEGVDYSKKVPTLENFFINMFVGTIIERFEWLCDFFLNLKTHHFFNPFYQQVNLWLILNNLIILNLKKNVFKYCPRGYIEGGYYSFIRPSSAGIIRMRVLIKGGPYMRKYGNSVISSMFIFRSRCCYRYSFEKG